jgi:hypothetical protein
MLLPDSFSDSIFYKCEREFINVAFYSKYEEIIVYNLISNIIHIDPINSYN